jgi:chemotaxis protein methyltransferase CheR
LAIARDGVYAEASARGVPSDLSARYLVRDGHVVRVAPTLASGVRFEPHDLLGASLAPASAIVPSFHLVSLRNVLIHLDPRMKGFALAKLHACLAPGGVLVLGVDEDLTPDDRRSFVPYPATAPALRIFQKRESAE